MNVPGFTEMHGTKWQRQWFENSQFFSFLQNVAFWNSKHISWKASWVIFKFCSKSYFLASKLQNEPMMTVIHFFSHVLWSTQDRQFLPLKKTFYLKNRKFAEIPIRLFIGISTPWNQVSTIGVSLFEQQCQSRKVTINISCQPRFHFSSLFA